MQELAPKLPKDDQLLNSVAPKMLRELNKKNYDLTLLRDKKQTLEPPNDKYGKLNVLEQYLVKADEKYLK